MVELKPCPFCGGTPELDTRRYYKSLEGRSGSGVAIYCVSNDPHCVADMMLCREDMPECSTDDLVAELAEQWNRRHNEPAHSRTAGASSAAPGWAQDGDDECRE